MGTETGVAGVGLRAARRVGVPANTSAALLALLFAVYAIDWADRVAVGAVGPQLMSEFDIGNAELGLLASAFTVVGALATLPAGVLVDRLPRTTLLARGLVAWAIAMVAAGCAPTFLLLLAARALLGVLAAVAGPAVPSLVGDATPPRHRSRAMALVDSGQIVGIGLGYVVAGAAVGLLFWRWAFWLLALPALLVARWLWRRPDPERGRADREGEEDSGPEVGSAEPDPDLVLERPERVSVWRGLGYVVRVKTNVALVLATAVGQYFFAGMSTFSVVYVTEQYGISTSEADLGLPVVAVGALLGMFAGAWLGDRLQGAFPNAQLLVGGVAMLAAGALAWPAIVTRSLAVAVPTIVLGTAFLNAATPTLDAVRLSVIAPELRGRAEGLRTVARTAAEGLAPLCFGLLADNLAGGGHAGLRMAFLVTLPAVAANGLLVLLATRWYPQERAAAAASGGAA